MMTPTQHPGRLMTYMLAASAQMLVGVMGRAEEIIASKIYF